MFLLRRDDASLMRASGCTAKKSSTLSAGSWGLWTFAQLAVPSFRELEFLNWSNIGKMPAVHESFFRWEWQCCFRKALRTLGTSLISLCFKTIHLPHPSKKADGSEVPDWATRQIAHYHQVVWLSCSLLHGDHTFLTSTFLAVTC